MTILYKDKKNIINRQEKPQLIGIYHFLSLPLQMKHQEQFLTAPTEHDSHGGQVYDAEDNV